MDAFDPEGEESVRGGFVRTMVRFFVKGGASHAGHISACPVRDGVAWETEGAVPEPGETSYHEVEIPPVRQAFHRGCSEPEKSPKKARS